MVMVVADPVLEARRRPGRLDAPDQALGDQQPKRVVHRLQRDGADFSSDGIGHGIGGDVRLSRYRPQHRQALGGDLNTALPKDVCRDAGHATG
jgi:hypothetical protein